MYPPHREATDMLVDENNANIFPLLGEAIECRFDGGGLSLAVDDQEVLLGIRTSRNMLSLSISNIMQSYLVPCATHADASQKQSRY